MPDKPIVLLEPYFRPIERTFSPAGLERLHATVDVVWGKDEPMPVEAAREAMRRALAVVCCGWRYGALPEDAPALRAIMDISGSFPCDLDYETSFARGIRVLSAPAFAPQVAEMALGMALAASREIVTGHEAMRAGTERWGWRGNLTSFLPYDQPVGCIGYGNLARAPTAAQAVPGFDLGLRPVAEPGLPAERGTPPGRPPGAPFDVAASMNAPCRPLASAAPPLMRVKSI